jgi:hypothetical protein
MFFSSENVLLESNYLNVPGVELAPKTQKDACGEGNRLQYQEVGTYF